MKTYKLNNIEISEKSAREFIKNNPELLEKKVSGRYFFPKVGEKYYSLRFKGEYLFTQNNNGEIDKDIIETGNAFRTLEDLKLADSKRQAIVRCWKWQQENAPFEPDWNNEKQDKYYVRFDNDTNKFYGDASGKIQTQFTLPYFKSAEDRDKFIEANKEDLLLLFTK